MQRADVLRRGRSERAFDGLDVDVVEGGAGVVLGELFDEVVQVRELTERPGRLAVAEGLIAAHPLAPVPGEVGPQRPEVVAQRGQLRREVGVAQRGRHEPGELLALLRRQRGHEPLGGRRLPGQLVDELVHVLRLPGEEVPVLWP